MSALRAVCIPLLAGLAACDGTPGEARIELYEPASAESRWQHTLPSQEFSVEPPARGESRLRVDTSDFCWDANYSMEFERSTGKLYRRWRREPRAETSGDPTAPVNTRCESGLVAQRITLSNDRLLHLCAYTEAGVLTVLNPNDGSERLRLSPFGAPLPRVAGDYLLIETVEPQGLETYSLLTGELLWSWTAPEAYTYQVGDAERVYLLAQTSAEAYAIALADGTAVWQKTLACDSLSLAADALVCHQTLRHSSCEHD